MQTGDGGEGWLDIWFGVILVSSWRCEAGREYLDIIIALTEFIERLGGNLFRQFYESAYTVNWRPHEGAAPYPEPPLAYLAIINIADDGEAFAFYAPTERAVEAALVETMRLVHHIGGEMLVSIFIRTYTARVRRVVGAP